MYPIPNNQSFINAELVSWGDSNRLAGFVFVEQNKL
jgi:hypothetical protein